MIFVKIHSGNVRKRYDENVGSQIFVWWIIALEIVLFRRNHIRLHDWYKDKLSVTVIDNCHTCLMQTLERGSASLHCSINERMGTSQLQQPTLHFLFSLFPCFYSGFYYVFIAANSVFVLRLLLTFEGEKGFAYSFYKL